MDGIYLSPPDMRRDERRRLIDAFDSNWITRLGPEVDGVESDLASFISAGSVRNWTGSPRSARSAGCR